MGIVNSLTTQFGQEILFRKDIDTNIAMSEQIIELAMV